MSRERADAVWWKDRSSSFGSRVVEDDDDEEEGSEA